MDDHPSTPLQRLDQAESFRLLVAAVEDYAIFMLTPDGHVATWNAGAERIKRYRADEIVGQHFSVFYTDEDVLAGKCEFELAVAAREGRFEDEAWRVRKDGTTFWANVVITALRDVAGGLIGFAKLTRDLTDRRRAEQERIALAQAQEAVRLRDEFLLLAAHELRTPLTAVLLQLQSLVRMAHETVVVQRLGRAIASSRRLATLLDLLLDVVSISTSRVVLDRRALDLRELVGELVDELQEASEQAGASLEFVGDAPVVGTWDRLRLEGAVMNLIANSMKYGGGSPIEVSVRSENGAGEIRVKDHGPGVSAADLPRIFDRFERAAPIGNYGGLGLGLYLVREIALAHGGSVSVERPDGGGACFVIRLPLDEPVPRCPAPPAP